MMKTSLTLLFSWFLFAISGLTQNFETSTINSIQNSKDLYHFGNDVQSPKLPDFGHDKIISENRSGQDTQDSTLTWYWDAEVDVWELSRITYYTSDLNNNILSKRTITWDGSQWNNLDLESLTYDDFNNVTNQLFQEWVGSEWVNTVQYVFTYDADNNRIRYLVQNWDGVQWVDHLQFIYTYDAEHHLLNRVSQTWQSTEWINQFNVVYTYDGDLQTTTLAQHWVDEWINQSLSFLSYNADNNLDTLLNQRYISDEWVDNHRDIFEYDGNGNQTSILSQLPEGDSLWVDYYQLFYDYDNNHNVISLLYQEYLNGVWENVDLFTAGYDVNENRIFDVYKYWEEEWVNQDSVRHYYTFSTSIKNSLADDNISIFPNPALNSLSIISDVILEDPYATFFTITGTQVLTAKINAGEIDISKLPAGYYHLLLQSEKEIVFKKFVKL